MLEEALEVAGVSRSRDYGHPLPNHERIAAIWSAILSDILLRPMTAEQAALCMIGMKVAREANASKRDNLVDICGYVRCLELIQEERERIHDAEIADGNTMFRDPLTPTFKPAF